MVLASSTEFQDANALAVKQPVYLVHFDDVPLLDDCGDTSTITDWVEAYDGLNPADETTFVKQGSHSMALGIDADLNVADRGDWVNSQSQGDLSAYQHDWIYLWMYFPTLDYLVATGVTGYFEIGNDPSTPRKWFEITKAGLSVGWNLLKCDLDNPSGSSGTIDWTDIDHMRICILTVADNTNDFTVYVDSIRVASGVDYATSNRISSPTNTIKTYVRRIKGNSQKITPEEGKSSAGQVTISILDYNDEITKLIAEDTYNLHRKKVTIKAGYADLTEGQMLTAFTGWVTDIKMWSDGCGYDITISDPFRWLQRKIFRNSETVAASLGGNPIDILLRILISTGAGDDGIYDVYAAVNGLGIGSANVNVTHIEAERDTWFHGMHFGFSIDERQVALGWLTKEIFKPCNIYPIIKGDGKFDIKVYRPPLPEEWNRFEEFAEDDNIIGLPSWNQNLGGTINEIEFHYDWDGSEYGNELFFTRSASVTNRGPGKKVLKIESKGIQGSLGAYDFCTRRANRVFSRYAEPPPKVQINTFFDRQLSEVGDIVKVTHSKFPNLAESTRGVTGRAMEIIDRSIDWERGKCRFTLLETDWQRNKYGHVSPGGTLVSGTTQSVTLTAGEGEDWTTGWKANLYTRNMSSQALAITIATKSSDTLTFTTGFASTAKANWVLTFADFDNCTTEQRRFTFMADASTLVGTGDTTPYYVY